MGKMRYLLVHVLPRAIGEAHRQLILDTAAAFNVDGVVRDGLPPHVSLKYWFEADPSQRDEVIACLRAFAQTHAPVSYRLQGVGSSARTVFRDVVASPEMRELHAELSAELRALPWVTWEAIDHPQAHYHATVASPLDPGIVPQVRDFVISRARNEDVTLSTLTLLERSTPSDAADGDHRITATIELAY